MCAVGPHPRRSPRRSPLLPHKFSERVLLFATNFSPAGLKVVGPLIYGSLYVRGCRVGVPQAPFFLNIALTTAALLLGPIALAAGSEDGSKES